MPGMNATAALDIPPCRRYVIVKATAGFAVFRLILKSLLFYSCLDFTQNLGEILGFLCFLCQADSKTAVMAGGVRFCCRRAEAQFFAS